MSSKPPSSALVQAIELFKQGNTLQAEDLVTQAVDEAKAKFGEVSPQYTAALFDLSSFYLMMENYPLAADVMREAVEVPLSGHEGQKDHLTYLRNLGEILIRADELDEAEKVLRQGVEERRNFYGPTHAGYAFGLEPLAELVWLNGNQQEAVDLIDEAVDILWKEANPQVFQTLALRAFIYRSVGVELSPFADIKGLPPEYVDEISDHVVRRSSYISPELGLVVVNDLLDWLVALRGKHHPSLLQVLATKSNLAFEMENHAQRQSALAALVCLCEAIGNQEQAIEAESALALAQSDAELVEESAQSYLRAIKRAQTFGNRAILSGVLRNYGLFLSEQERPEEAESFLRKALFEAQAAQDQIRTGKALIALGIFLQHSGWLTEAQELLEQALGILPLAHPDTFYARNHLDAITTKGSCGCGDMDRAVSTALKEMVEQHVPVGLLKDVQFDENFNVQVELLREPTDEEAELLDKVIQHALRELRHNIKNARHS